VLDEWGTRKKPARVYSSRVAALIRKSLLRRILLRTFMAFQLPLRWTLGDWTRWVKDHAY
jgi:hypothetical protein